MGGRVSARMADGERERRRGSERTVDYSNLNNVYFQLKHRNNSKRINRYLRKKRTNRLFTGQNKEKIMITQASTVGDRESTSILIQGVANTSPKTHSIIVLILQDTENVQ